MKVKTYPTVVKLGGITRIKEMTASERGRTEANLDREVRRRASYTRFTHDEPYMQPDWIYPNASVIR